MKESLEGHGLFSFENPLLQGAGRSHCGEHRLFSPSVGSHGVSILCWGWVIQKRREQILSSTNSQHKRQEDGLCCSRRQVMTMACFPNGIAKLWLARRDIQIGSLSRMGGFGHR